MNFQDAAALTTPDGSVKNIHNKNSDLLWSAVGYNVRYDGDTTQQTYTGKNLIDFKLSNLNERNTSVTENNGIFTMTATSTNLPRVTISTTSSLVVGNTYTLSAYIRARSVTNGYTYMRMRETVGGGDWIPSVPSQQSISVSSDFVKYSLTFTATVSNPAIWFYLSSLASQTILADFDVKDVQIEAGSSATTYEPYVGDSPAPNPDYPQDVNVVQGHQVVTVKDKNLLIVPNDSYSSNGIDWVRNGNSKIHGSGTLSGYTWSNTGSTAIPLNLPPGTYTFSIKNPLPSPLQIEFATFDNNSTRINYQIPVNGTSTTRNFPNGLKSTTVAVVRGVIGDYYDITIENVQIEAGSSATTFEQPQSKTVNFDLRGKNLFDKSVTPTKSSNSFTVSPIDNGIRLTATGTLNSSVLATYLLCNVSKDVGRRLTVSANMASSAQNAPRISVGYCDAAGNNRTTIATIDSSGKTSFTITEARVSVTPYIYIYAYINKNSSTTAYAGDYIDYTNLQVEIDDVEPSTITYQPYHAPIELCKIGNYQDYIYKGADGWYVHKDIGKIILDGSNDEDWGISYPGTNNYFYRYKYLTGFVYEGSNTPWVSNIVTHGSIGSTTTSEGGMITDVGEVRIRYGTEMSLADWLAKLATTNIILYYALATPTNTKITDATITTQLDAIHDWLRRYDYYGVVSGNLPIIINRSGII